MKIDCCVNPKSFLICCRAWELAAVVTWDCSVSILKNTWVCLESIYFFLTKTLFQWCKHKFFKLLGIHKSAFGIDICFKNMCAFPTERQWIIAKTSSERMSLIDIKSKVIAVGAYQNKMRIFGFHSHIQIIAITKMQSWCTIILEILVWNFLYICKASQKLAIWQMQKTQLIFAL